MELVEVEILGQVITSQHGTLKTGAILRVDAAFAKHLVDDCNAAKYTTKGKPKSDASILPSKVAKSKKAVEKAKGTGVADSTATVVTPAAILAAGAEAPPADFDAPTGGSAGVRKDEEHDADSGESQQ